MEIYISNILKYHGCMLCPVSTQINLNKILIFFYTSFSSLAQDLSFIYIYIKVSMPNNKTFLFVPIELIFWMHVFWMPQFTCFHTVFTTLVQDAAFWQDLS